MWSFQGIWQASSWKIYSKEAKPNISNILTVESANTFSTKYGIQRINEIPGRLLDTLDSRKGRQGWLGRRLGKACILQVKSKDRSETAVTCSDRGTKHSLSQIWMTSISGLIYSNPSFGQKMTQFPLKFAHSTTIPHSLHKTFSHFRYKDFHMDLRLQS